MILYLALLNYILLLFIKISLKSRMAVIPSFLFKKKLAERWFNNARFRDAKADARKAGVDNRD